MSNNKRFEQMRDQYVSESKIVRKRINSIEADLDRLEKIPEVQEFFKVKRRYSQECERNEFVSKQIGLMTLLLMGSDDVVADEIVEYTEPQEQGE